MTDVVPDPTSLSEALRNRRTELVPAPIGQLPQVPTAAAPIEGFLDRWSRDLQERYGVETRLPDRVSPYKNRVLAPLRDANLPTFQAYPDTGLPTIDATLPNLRRSFEIAWEQTPFGAARRMSLELHKTGALVDEDYDPYRDPAIEQAGLGDQMHLFRTSRSASATQDLIERVRRNQKDADWMQRVDTVTAGAGMAGGLLGDPLTYLPTTMPVKALQIANRLRLGLASGTEIAAIAQRPAIYGALADGLRMSALQLGVGVVENALMHSYDPTIPGDISTDLLLPAALGGSLALITGWMTRASGRTLAKEMRSVGYTPDPVRPAAGRPLGVPPATPEEEAAAFAAATERFQSGAYRPGDLATDYGPTRVQEHQADPATQGFTQRPVGGRPITPPGHRDLLDPRGERDVLIDDKLVSAGNHAPGTRVIDDKGVEWERAANPNPGIDADVWKAISFNEAAPKAAGDVTQMEFAVSEGAHQPGSVGAMLSPQSLAYQRSVLLAQGRLAPTGIGLEHLPINPIVRAFQGASLAAMRFAADLASTGGLQTVGNRQGIANLVPVEMMVAMNWTRPTVEVVRRTQDEWSAYRQAIAKATRPPQNATDLAGRSDWQRLSEQVGTALKDRLTPGEKPLSFAQFRDRVGRAMNKGDVDQLGDGASDYVNRAAAHNRQLWNTIKQEASDLGLFDEAYEGAVFDAQSELRALKKEADATKVRAQKEKWSATRTREAEEALLVRTEDAQKRFQMREEELTRLRTYGPQLNGTAASYRPRLWRADKLIDGEERFLDITVGWLQSKMGGALDTPEAARIAKQIHETLSKQNPVYDRGDMQALFKGVASPGSALARSFKIPDALVDDFLEHDIETLTRYHSKQMGAAIEMKRRFGTLDAREEIDEIFNEYKGLIDDAKAQGKAELAATLTQQQKTAVADAQALRDKLYGSYGASPDPHRWQSRTIRAAKQFSNLTLLGMSGITALGDLVRPVMTEGLEAVYGYGFKSLMSEARSTILKMNRLELELEGNGMELLNNVRAMQAADTGDVFGSRSRFENGMNAANQWMFVANGLNAVNQIDKEWARLSIGGRVNHVLLDWEAGARPSERDIARFAAVGIDEPLARRIAIQLKVHGQDFGSGGTALTMPNTTAWTDEQARIAYRSAMNQMVNRTVPTPGIGDRPNFMSTEIGGLLTQYKSFGVASLIRGAYSGLQEGGRDFWYGAAMAVGFAVILNEIRSQLFYGKSSFDKPLGGVLADGLDRASILGSLGDANRAIETLTGNRVGVKPMLGAATPQQPTLVNYAGLAGPSVQQGARVLSVANDVTAGHLTAKTFRNWRALTPGGTLPYFDPAFDALLPGDYRQARTH